MPRIHHHESPNIPLNIQISLLLLRYACVSSGDKIEDYTKAYPSENAFFSYDRQIHFYLYYVGILYFDSPYFLVFYQIEPTKVFLKIWQLRSKSSFLSSSDFGSPALLTSLLRRLIPLNSLSRPLLFKRKNVLESRLKSSVNMFSFFNPPKIFYSNIISFFPILIGSSNENKKQQKNWRIRKKWISLWRKWRWQRRFQRTH